MLCKAKRLAATHPKLFLSFPWKDSFDEEWWTEVTLTAISIGESKARMAQEQPTPNLRILGRRDTENWQKAKLYCQFCQIMSRQAFLQFLTVLSKNSLHNFIKRGVGWGAGGSKPLIKLKKKIDQMVEGAYLIFVTGTTGAARVKISVRCKFFQIERKKIHIWLFWG